MGMFTSHDWRAFKFYQGADTCRMEVRNGCPELIKTILYWLSTKFKLRKRKNKREKQR